MKSLNKFKTGFKDSYRIKKLYYNKIYLKKKLIKNIFNKKKNLNL